ncbi:hypothetical protein PoB_001119500, partial [Plakobranchus ocellatus]
MGQATSKRRSYTPGGEKFVETTTKPSRTNGDLKSSGLANGSIEVRASDSGQIEAEGPTSPTSVTSDNSTGRKETKRRRFRVSGLFSLKRTPSGKWPRRRKTTASSMNGTRPVSCPDPHSDTAAVASPARPQSLFLEELEINEDDNKIETVDLSDHEQDSKSKPKASKASTGDGPKPKGRRGSKKQSSLKKKKQEKKNSQKDKKGKNKMKATAAESEDASQEITADKSELVDSTVAVAKELTSSWDTSEKTEDTRTSLDLTQQVLAHIDSKALEKEEKDEEKVNIEKGDEEEEDLDAMASSIVAETMDIAQKRLGEEKSCCEDKEDPISAINHVEEDEIVSDPKDLTTITAGEEAKVVVEKAILTSAEEQLESCPANLEGESFEPTITTQESSPPPQAPPRSNRHSITHTPDINASYSSQEANQASKSLEESMNPTDGSKTVEVSEQKLNPALDLPIVGDSTNVINAETVGNLEEEIQKPTLQTSANAEPLVTTAESIDIETAAVPSIEATVNASSNMSVEVQPFNEVPVDVAEEIAAATASVAEIERTEFANDAKGESLQNKPEKEDKVVSEIADSQKQDIVEHVKDKNEKKRLEKERLKKEKEAEKAKEKKRQQEEKRKKAEQKSAEKEKSKSERKIKVPKRLSSLFHKKDKQPKSVDVEVDPSVSGPGTSQNGSETGKIEDGPSDLSVAQEVETMVCPLEQANSSSENKEPDASAPSAQISSLSVDVSVEPSIEATCSKEAEVSPESQPMDGDVSSPPPLSPLESPLSGGQSPDSDTSEPTSPGSDSEINGSSGGSNVLKKISLGPRLRTAILRKKSSGASDSGVERTVSLTTPKSVAEAGEMTPPPRKLRPRKPVEQYSPITPGAHNPPLTVLVAEDANAKEDTKSDDKNVMTNAVIEDIVAKVDGTVSYASCEGVAVSENDSVDLKPVVEEEIIKVNKDDTKTKNSIIKQLENISLHEQSIIVEDNVAIHSALENVTNEVIASPPATSSDNSSNDQIVQHTDISINSSSCNETAPTSTESSAPSCIVEEVLQASKNDSVSCQIVSFHAKTHEFLKDNSEATQNLSDSDDTDPSALSLQKPSDHCQQDQQQQQLSETPTVDDDPEIFTTATSPTLVSTASIVLRPSSVDDTCPEAEAAFVDSANTFTSSVCSSSQAKSSADFPEVKSLTNSNEETPDDSSSLSPAKKFLNTSSQQEETGEICYISYVNGEHSKQKHSEDSTEKVSVPKEEEQETAQAEEEKRTTGSVEEKQIYTAVCAAQVYDDTKVGVDDEEEDDSVAAPESSVSTTRVIAEYQIGTLEEAMQADVAKDQHMPENEVNAGNIDTDSPEASTEDNQSSSANVTIRADGNMPDETANTSYLSHGPDNSDSGDSGQQTPTASHPDNNVDSVLNGIVKDALNGVLHGNHDKEDESNDAGDLDNSSDRTPRAGSDSNDSKIFSGLEIDNKMNADEQDGNEENTKDVNSVDSINKPSPTETIEAYLKLQYQEGGEGIGVPYVNGDK